MNPQEQFLVLAREGVLSRDIFIIVPEQPAKVKAGCRVVIDQRDGCRITVHQSRRVRIDATPEAVRPQKIVSACMNCGRVEGVVRDEVVCPYHGGGPCRLLEARPDESLPKR